jgi:putative ABC transport system ATP-binding protein
MSDAAIQCIGIVKSFAHNGLKPLEVLHGIDLSIDCGQMVMLMGPSGSGKTTLLAIVGGILAPTSGKCLILGKDMNVMGYKEVTQFRGHKIGFLFQKFMLVPTLTAIENVVIPLLCQGVSREEAFEKAALLLESMGLKDQTYYTSDKLSGGEQQRVALARAMIHNPDILLCDEPTSFLDSERGQQIMQLLKDIQQKNHTTVVVVTHDDRILAFADRIIEIEDGKIKGKSSLHSQKIETSLPAVIP